MGAHSALKITCSSYYGGIFYTRNIHYRLKEEFDFPLIANHARIQRGAEVRTPPPLKNHKNIGFLSNIGPEPLTNHKATRLAFNVGPSSDRHANETPFQWYLDPPSPYSLKIIKVKPIALTTFCIRACTFIAVGQGRPLI